jgi:hypothetical protein
MEIKVLKANFPQFKKMENNTMKEKYWSFGAGTTNIKIILRYQNDTSSKIISRYVTIYPPSLACTSYQHLSILSNLAPLSPSGIDK